MAAKNMKQAGRKTGVSTRVKFKEPSRYKVIMLNDDFTPMDFVVDVLVEIFHKEKADAVDLMMKVHREGRAIVGVYTYDIALTRQQRAIRRARDAGYPFNITLEEE